MCHPAGSFKRRYTVNSIDNLSQTYFSHNKVMESYCLDLDFQFNISRFNPQNLGSEMCIRDRINGLPLGV